jgi:uncharacterized protein (TIGR02466 family)
MKLSPLFATYIYQQKLIPILKKETRLFSQLAEEVEVLMLEDHAGHRWCKKNYPLGYTSYGSLDQLQNLAKPFKKLRQLIDPHVDDYLKHLDYDCKLSQVDMCSMWVNVMPKGVFHSMHIHPKSIISGTFYLQIPKGSSCIKFEDPRWSCFMNTPDKKASARAENKRFFEIQPKEGDLVLFESWLKHEVPINSTEEPRISISFNYNWKS